MGFISEQQLADMGFKHLGRNVKISEKASIYNPGQIAIDDYARVDDFCILSAGEGGISIGKYVHVACYSSLMGQGCIVLEDFSGLSSRVMIYSSNDDYSGDFMAHPTVPKEFTNVIDGDVILRKHAIIGAGTVILPDVEIGMGAVIGALSLVKDDCEPFGVYGGCPVRKIKKRRRKLLELEKLFIEKNNKNC